MRRIRFLFTAAAPLLLVGCAAAEPPAEAARAPASSSEAVTSAGAAAPASPSTLTPPPTQDVHFLARWIPDNPADTEASQGIVNVHVNGHLIDREVEARLPSKHAGVDYYFVTATGASSGTDVDLSVTTITSTPGRVECTISVEGFEGPLDRQVGGSVEPGGELRTVDCNAQVP